jgi:hypothetical protein
MTWAGSGSETYGDGMGTNAGIYHPFGITLDTLGNAYIVTGENRVRKIWTSAFVTTLAGSGSAGYVDGAGLIAMFNNPYNIDIDSNKNLFIADFSNSKIRKMTFSGVVTTLAGSVVAGYADGVGSAVEFMDLFSMHVDLFGNILVSNDDRLRYVIPSGITTSIAGSGTEGSIDGVGTAATFGEIWGINTDSSMNIYVSSTTTNTIRKITSGMSNHDSFIDSFIG